MSRTLASRGVDAPHNAARRAVVAAFDPSVRTRERAVDSVARARENGPVGLLVNCAVPELVGRVLVRSDLARDDFDAVVTSVACGWRKPDRRAFERVADALGVEVAGLAHVGCDDAVDGAVVDAGGRYLDAVDGLSAVHGP